MKALLLVVSISLTASCASYYQTGKYSDESIRKDEKRIESLDLASRHSADLGYTSDSVWQAKEAQELREDVGRRKSGFLGQMFNFILLMVFD